VEPSSNLRATWTTDDKWAAEYYEPQQSGVNSIDTYMCGQFVNVSLTMPELVVSIMRPRACVLKIHFSPVCTCTHHYVYTY
jgi:hypothetical protein